MHFWKVLIILAGVKCHVASSNNLKQLTLQGFLPMTGRRMAVGGACLPAVMMALRHVNERPGLLDGYNLTYTWVDTQVKIIYIYIYLVQYYNIFIMNVIKVARAQIS